MKDVHVNDSSSDTDREEGRFKRKKVLHITYQGQGSCSRLGNVAMQHRIVDKKREHGTGRGEDKFVGAIGSCGSRVEMCKRETKQRRRESPRSMQRAEWNSRALYR